jgi:hypothetical protein
MEGRGLILLKYDRYRPEVPGETPLDYQYTLNLKNEGQSQVPMAHAYNPSYPGDRDQEDSSSKTAQENSSQDPMLKKTITKKELVE